MATMVAARQLQATSLGLLTDPAGPAWDRGDANSAHATWDTYPQFTFTNDAPDTSAGATASLSQSRTVTGSPFTDRGAGTYNNVTTDTTTTQPGDVFLTGGIGATFTLAGTTDFGINAFYLQLKRASSTASLVGNANAANDVVVSLNTLAPTSVNTTSGTGDTTSDATGSYSVTTWYWTGEALSNLNLTSFNVVINVPAVTRALDGIVIDASAVPEPTSFALLAIPAAMLIRRRAR